MSSRAMRRSSVKTQRIFSELPTSCPKDSAPATSTSVARAATFTASFVLPSSTLSPLETKACRMRRPSRNVPLRLPVSRSRRPCGSRSTSRWRRLTVGSLSTRSPAPSEPTRTSESRVVTFLPLSGPDTTSTVHS